MPTYGDAAVIKKRSGIDPGDLSNVANQDELDSLIQDLNERVSNAIERWCNRDFEHHQGVTETTEGDGDLDEEGHGRLRLEGWPIISISEIKVDGRVLDASDYRIVTLDGQPSKNVGVVQRKNMPWPEAWETVEVTYDWGYQTPPSGVKAVAEDLVIDALRQSVGDDNALAAESISMDGFSVSYFESTIERSERHKDRIQPYRRLSLGVS